MSYTIKSPDGSFAMRVVRVKAGCYWLNLNLKPIVAETFYTYLRKFYDITLPQQEDDTSTFYLKLRLMAYEFERDHLRESLANLYESSLQIHQGHYFFKPRTK